MRRRQRTDRDRSRSQPNICTSNNGDNRNSREVNNAPGGRGLLGEYNTLKDGETSLSPRPGISLGRGGPLEMVRNDICSYSTSHEQNRININQYVTSNNNNVEGDQGGVYDTMPDYSDLEMERERERKLKTKTI